MSNDGTTTLFDRWSATYDNAQLQRSTYAPIHDNIIRRSRDLAPRRILDLGCGTGQLTERLAKTFADAHIIGVDLSPGMLAKAGAAAACENVSLLQADAGRLPIPADSVDFVVCTESFHWYPDQLGVLRGLHDVMTTDARLMIASIATVTDVGERVVRAVSSVNQAPIRARPPGQLRDLLQIAGFDVKHQRRIPRLGVIGWPVLTDASRRTLG